MIDVKRMRELVEAHRLEIDQWRADPRCADLAEAIENSESTEAVRALPGLLDVYEAACKVRDKADRWSNLADTPSGQRDEHWSDDLHDAQLDEERAIGALCFVVDRARGGT